MSDAKTLRQEIAESIANGFGDQFAGFKEWDDATDVHIHEHDEPITVWRDDVDVPDEYGPEIASMISLDVRAILADDQMKAES